MSTPDPMYISSTPLEWYFVDKDTGAPLAAGVVTFYEQDNQTVKKPVYQLDNSSPTGFSELNNPITLTAVGTFADNNGNDIIPYFFPFDAAGNTQLYYVTVYSSGGVLQFTRQDWPPNLSPKVTPFEAQEIVNYVANGQFLLNNTSPISATVTTIGTDTVYYIAPGGWSFEKESTSTSTDTISFIREVSSSTNPNVDANPRYFFKIVTTNTDGNYQRKDLCLTFPDVNKFAGDPTIADSTYTFSFQGSVSSGGSVAVDVRLRKIFGVGGSTDTDISLGTILLSPSEAVYNLSFEFGDNSGDHVGPADDDYLQICVRFPNSAQTVLLTDFVLTQGSVPVDSFPQTTNAEFIQQSTIGYLPTPDHAGNDLYLPIMLTDKGTVVDRSRIGMVVGMQSLTNFAGTLHTQSNLMLADGSQRFTADYSPLGVPYSRYGSYLLSAGGGLSPLYGTGDNFSFAALIGTTEIELMNNQFGTGANATDAGSTGFAFRNLCSEKGSSDVLIHRYFATALYCRGVSLTMSDGGAATSIVFTVYRTGLGGNYNVYTIDTSGATISSMASTYFTFSANSNSYYCWFKYNGTGTDPAPGGTGILVNLYTGYNTTDLAFLLNFALYGCAGTSITPVAGASVVASSYFAFTVNNSLKYFVWYNLNGTGIAPTPVGYSRGISVTYTTAMTAAQVTSATALAINSACYKVPDFRGLFLRGYDPNKTWDLDASTRYGLNVNISANVPGTFEYDAFLTHTHTTTLVQQTTPNTYAQTPASDAVIWPHGTTVATSAATGGDETRPVNANVVWAVYY